MAAIIRPRPSLEKALAMCEQAFRGDRSRQYVCQRYMDPPTIQEIRQRQTILVSAFPSRRPRTSTSRSMAARAASSRISPHIATHTHTWRPHPPAHPVAAHTASESRAPWLLDVHFGHVHLGHVHLGCLMSSIVRRSSMQHQGCAHACFRTLSTRAHICVDRGAVLTHPYCAGGPAESGAPECTAGGRADGGGAPDLGE